VDAPCEYLDWDSRFFGIEIARVTTRRLDGCALEAVDRWCAMRHIDCLYFLAEGSPPASTTVAEDGGFHLVDLRATLARSTEPAPGGPAPAGIFVRRAQPSDLPALRAIARVSHRDSRFYRDGHFAEARCNALYETWIEKSCAGGAAAVLVAEVEGTVTGYVTCERPAGASARVGLLAVDATHRGRGIGEALVRSSLAWFAANDVALVHVVTQGTNIGAQRLYQRYGFRTDTVQLWYHRWRNGGRGA
jgi:dTDP-4-amino-4,6-dideoxy-D-galactose acyltransferase